ncbi:MAG: ABC transporter ATP-binding protein [Armatimonadota bacterium]|nr:ABC transporter ATP-binding protein [Armatimonadota bacterium]
MPRRRSRPPKKRSNLWRLIGYIKPYWLHFAAATACGLVKMLVPVAIAYMIGEFVNILSLANAGKITHEAAWGQLRHFMFMGTGVLLIAPVPIYLRSSLAARATQEVVCNLRCDLYAHIQKLSHSFFDSNRSGWLTSRIIGDVEAVQPFIGRAFVQVWMSIGMISVVLGYLFYKNVHLGLISICMVPVQLLIQRKLGWKVQENACAVRDRLADLSGSAQEKLSAATIVKAFTGENEEIQRFSDSSSSLVDLGVKNSKLGGLSEACMGFTRISSQLLLILAGGYLALFHSEKVSIGLLLQFIMMQGQIYMPFEWLNEMQLLIAAALGASDRIFTIFDTEPEIANKPGAIRAKRFTGEIVLENVTFSYPSSSRKVFDNLSLVAPARTTLALVGPSGGGKTTVTNLLNRFYDWDEGRILIDGRDIRDYTIYSLRSQIGLVPQEPILFSGTIEENILYGRPGASFEEVKEAARRAYALEFIEETEDGFNTMLGERGVRLSGGQKQRVSIARAFLKDPSIIVLDEATSALDSESELIVQQAIEDLMKDRTTLVIAHRLSTIRNADQIAVIDDGRVVELGEHEELLGLNGIYARLCSQQFELLPETWERYKNGEVHDGSRVTSS